MHKEFKSGLEVLEEIPESKIFVIPARLNECKIPYEKLRKYHYVDLFPDWEGGVRRILQSTGVPVKYHESALTSRDEKMETIKEPTDGKKISLNKWIENHKIPIITAAITGVVLLLLLLASYLKG